MKFKNEFLLGSVSNYYYLYHNHCFPKQSWQSTLTVFCLLRKQFWHLSFIPAICFHTVRINPFDLLKTFPLFLHTMLFVNFLSTYNEGISIFRFACYFQKFNKFIKNFKWEEFVHIERKRAHYVFFVPSVLFHVQCIILHTVGNYIHSV